MRGAVSIALAYNKVYILSLVGNQKANLPQTARQDT